MKWIIHYVQCPTNEQEQIQKTTPTNLNPKTHQNDRKKQPKAKKYLHLYPVAVYPRVSHQRKNEQKPKLQTQRKDPIQVKEVVTPIHQKRKNQLQETVQDKTTTRTRS